jgi:uncharacterized damage-inducible protein DinB
MKRTEWFNRKFPVIEDNGLLPSIIERLAGTPARVEEIINHVKPDVLTMSYDGKWTIKEEVGHLADLEPLWLGRVNDLVDKAPELRAADLTNRKTHEANHNQTEISALLQQFRRQRLLLVNALRNVTDEQLENVSLHPRLKTPMRIIDLAYFVAEHDDHHLSGIRLILDRQ